MGFTKRQAFKAKHSSAGRRWGFSVIRGSDTPGTPERPYMTRMWIGRLRFHLFHRGDNDPDCHDHPWGFWTFPLRSYVEEVVVSVDRTSLKWPTPEPSHRTELRVVEAWRWHYRPATHCHRVIGSFEGWMYQDQFFPMAVSDVPRIGARLVPTIVWRDRPCRDWGFFKKRDGRWCWVPWKTYVYQGGKDAPCNE
jgi:hypothetical protein